MRGRLLRLIEHRQGARLTPAYAGKTLLRSRGGERDRAHPRVCGEDVACSTSPIALHGSPPRMRGRLHRRPERRRRAGLTPAYAGKTTRRPHAPTTSPAHPRVCGEDATRGRHARLSEGSPPRMRGRLRDQGDFDVGDRLTPAYAGKTTNRTTSHDPSSAHPRVCGEDPPGATLAGRMMGSPPRMRGRPLL